MSGKKQPLEFTNKLWRFIMHFPVGYAAAFPGGVSLAILFVVYELSQDRYKRDGAFIDVIGAVFGAGLGILVKWLS